MRILSAMLSTHTERISIPIGKVFLETNRKYLTEVSRGRSSIYYKHLMDYLGMGKFIVKVTKYNKFERIGGDLCPAVG